jgi:hypothetical protein
MEMRRKEAARVLVRAAKEIAKAADLLGSQRKEVAELLAHSSAPELAFDAALAMAEKLFVPPPPAISKPEPPEFVCDETVDVGKRVSWDALERKHVECVIARTKDLKEAATILGIDQATLFRKRRAWGMITKPGGKRNDAAAQKSKTARDDEREGKGNAPERRPRPGPADGSIGL